MTKIDDVIDFFLSKEGMVPKKLQRLLYFAYSWTLALLNESADDIVDRLFDEPMEAWPYGPVIVSVFEKYYDYIGGDISKKMDFDETVFPEDVLDVLNQVWKAYGGYTANELDEAARDDEPWLEARGNLGTFDVCHEHISDRTIFCYYNKQAVI